MAIDYSIVPGTTHLVDIDPLHSKIVLIPTPSDDPNDPLNWTRGRKLLHMVCVVLYVFATGIPGTCIYSIIPDIASAPGVQMSVADINAGTGYSFLFLGLGCLIFQPLAMQFGKRPVYLFSTLSCAMLYLWQPYITTNGEWIAAKILAGCVVAPIEALPEATISDLFFEHERATYMGIYACSLFGSNYVAPMVAGFINENSQDVSVGGWRWVIFWACIFCSLSFVVLFFFMEETNYERRLKVHSDEDGIPIGVITSNGEITGETREISKDNEENSSSRVIKIDHYKSANIENSSNSQIQDLDSEKMTAMVSVKAEISPMVSVKAEKSSQNLAILNNYASLVSEHSVQEYLPPKTFYQKLSLTSGVKSKFLLWEYFKAPFYMLRFPVVLWAGFLYGASLFWYTVLNATEALVLGSEPYNFSSAMCGLAYLSPCIFAVIIYFYAGWVSDWLKVRLAKKRRGCSQAEDRLWALSVYAVLGPCSLILWGVGASYGIHWFGVVFGLGLMAGLCLIGCVNAVTYVIDCYHEVSCEALATVIVIRNTMSFAMSYGITPWVENQGLKNCFIAAAFICLFCISTFLLMIKTGYYWRNKTKESYWRYIERRRLWV